MTTTIPLHSQLLLDQCAWFRSVSALTQVWLSSLVTYFVRVGVGTAESYLKMSTVKL